ncbi:MAG: hypothetical protein KDA91_14850 [Planctomycetaceae bacterium]|nr:hypothetical protein [Planctomycetaceae bacterium]
MSGRPYIDGDTLQDIRNAYGMGVPLDQLAAQVGITEPELRRLLGLPQWGPEVQTQPDLFADDRLDAVL